MIALYHPEIAQNVGTIMRTCACFNLPLSIIHPLGFVWDDKRLKRSHMDYDANITIDHYDSFDHFMTLSKKPIVILTPHADQSLYDAHIPHNALFLFGRESDGFQTHDQARILATPNNMAVRIPIHSRSLNLAVCVGVVMGVFNYKLNHGY